MHALRTAFFPRSTRGRENSVSLHGHNLLLHLQTGKGKHSPGVTASAALSWRLCAAGLHSAGRTPGGSLCLVTFSGPNGESFLVFSLVFWGRKEGSQPELHDHSHLNPLAERERLTLLYFHLPAGQWKWHTTMRAIQISSPAHLRSPTQLDSVHVDHVPSQTPWKEEAPEGHVADWNLPRNLTGEGNVYWKLSTDHSKASQLQPGSLLGSFIYNYEGASREVFSGTKCSEKFWKKSLRSVVWTFH